MQLTLGDEINIAYELAATLHYLNEGTDRKAVEAALLEKNPDNAEATVWPESKLMDLVTKQNFTGLLNELFKSMNKIMDADEEQIDCIFTLGFHVMKKVEQESVRPIIEKFATELSNDAQKHATLKLQLLIILFNNLHESSLLGQVVVVNLLKLALNSSNSALVANQLSSIDAWISQWRLDAKQTSEIFLLGYEVAATAGAAYVECAQDLLVKYLRSDKTAASKYAYAAALNSINSTSKASYFAVDVVHEIAAVQSLQGDKEMGPVVSLLNILAFGTVAEYEQFRQKHGVWLTANKQDEQELLSRMRTLTLCSMGRGKNHLTYDEVMKALSLKDKDAVEAVVVDAVFCGKLDGRLDQENEKVCIEKTAVRSFSKETWSALHSQLGAWKANLSKVIETVNKSQAGLQHDM